MALIRGESSNPNEPAVLGTSTAPDQGMGVMGTATRGSGVIGTSVDWIGVYGESNKFEGVRGTSKNKDHAGVVGTNEAGGSAFYGEGSAGLIAVGKQWVGVYGETQAQPGVGSAGIWGDGKNGGDGVKGHASAPGKSGVAGFHLTNQGPGIFGKGSPAGFFEGNVNITGNLNVNGFIFMGGDTVTPLASWIVRIRNLEAEIADLRRLISTGHPSGSTTTSATIGVELTPQSGAFNNLRIFGNGFQPNEPIEINVTSTSTSGSGGSNIGTATADSLGRFNHTIGVSCPSGMQTTHTAFARGITSGRISNKAGATC